MSGCVRHSSPAPASPSSSFRLRALTGRLGQPTCLKEQRLTPRSDRPRLNRGVSLEIPSIKDGRFKMASD